MSNYFEKMLVAETGTRHRDSNGRIMRSSAGAVGIAQVMPATGPEAAHDAGLPWDPVKFEEDADYNRTLGQAYHQKLLRTFGGDERKAIAAYNAGPGRVRAAIARNGADWEADLPDETKDYLRKVTGAAAAAGSAPAVLHPRTPTIEELLGSTPADLFEAAEEALDAAKQQRPDRGATVAEMVRNDLTGGDGIAIDPLDHSPVLAERAMEAAARAEQIELEKYGHWDRFEAGMSETLAGKLIDTFGEHYREFDPSFQKEYLRNWKQIESFAQTDEEVTMLRDARNADHLQVIQGQIEENRETQKIISTAASPTALMIGTGILDPVGWVGTLGVGKAFQLAGVGSRALIAAGRPGMAVASAAMEGAVGNLAVTAGLDATGDYVTPGEYAISALTGLGIGAAIGKASGMFAKDGMVADQIAAARQAREEHISGIRQQVVTDLPDATPEVVEREVSKRITDSYLDTIEYALADIPEDQRILVAEDIITQNDEFKKALSEANDLESVSDAAERAMVAEATARAERIADANPVDAKALKTVLASVGQEATSTRLLLSESPVAKAVALTLLENPQGAGGRQRTAAITAFMRERVYNEQLSGFDALAHQFRKKEGITLMRDAWDGRARNEFNRRVFREIERRGGKPEGTTFDGNPFVIEAADRFQAGMEKMRLEQQKVGTVGNARLGDNSVGYVPHRLDPRKVLSLTAGQAKRIRGVLAGQFQAIEGFDAEFSERLASKYLERATDAAAGRYHVPFNLHSPEAGEIVRDALEAMNLPADELDKIMGKFSRGGAGHTKRRLKLDLEADLGEGMKLMDLFVTDIPALYRSYARRVAGEVSLAQYGVMGKKGLTVLSKAMTATGATPEEVRAFDQVASEFLNAPFGAHSGGSFRWLDNIRMATSASRLGGMAFTQFAEFGNAIPSLGVQAAVRGVGSMPRHLADVRAIVHGEATPNPVLKSLDKMGGGTGMDDYHMTRMFDVRDNDIELYNGSELGVFSRAVRAGAHANMILSGHRMIVAAQTRSMAEEILRKAVTFAKSGKADKALDDMGIHQGLREAIRADLDRIATFDSKGRLTSLDMFNGKSLKPHMVAELAQSVERGAAQIIQRTFTGETGEWAHNGFIKLLAQFRTFSLISVEKQWRRNMRNYGALKSFMYLMAAASFALPIHLARMQTNMLSMSPSKREDYWEHNSGTLALTRATLNYASSAGLAGDIMDVGAVAFSSYGGDLGESFGDSYGIRGKRTDLAVGGIVAPSAGIVNDMWAGVFTGDPHKVIRSLPGSNLPYVTPFITAALEAAGEGDEW